MRYIDADEITNWLAKYNKMDEFFVGYLETLVETIPTVDVAEVVRCKDCEFYTEDEKWCRRLGLCGAFGADGFCSHGERREDATLH